ncbi:acetyl-CoA acetyltransferase [Conexibacter sp. JD483]|uniref:acetyl-CoA acetyltransferase n=1 Tax=unclassified Conexibacter TaxID=2627773 RepID=UPI0027210ED5|nr:MULTISPECIES: acetyl-CoA acetyltransferase [unclassified Conexibacter]MDO8187686.1 acetyl-CoA acetyltransferase [Conexibacter sp. CPCC 205706]MDO8199871.1 acetyl-CoA acetyltransferase [Conexibacter sp. CPCC 205762]MDR9370248.1 acetyl-CoA acetyltransferase [Conexibacter sp. JD483]
MASRGLSDRVAIVGMGCTPFRDHWDRSADDLIVDAVQECLASVPAIARADVDAYWVGTQGSGMSGMTLSKPLRMTGKPVTRVENFCATGSEAFRNACFAVASGAYDVVMATGVEKLKDSSFSGLTATWPPSDGTDVEWTAPGAFSLLAPAYADRYGVGEEQLRETLTHIAWKNHRNGALNARAQFRKEVPRAAISGAMKIAGPLGVMDCSGVADGAAAALIVRAEDAHLYTDRPVYLKGMGFVSGAGEGTAAEGYDFTTFPEVVASAQEAYRQAGVTDPRSEIALAEVHDCFTPTELVLMEDLGFSARGEGWRDVLDGAFDRDGAVAVNPDGGLKSFGHPIGATGLRMLFECFTQLRGEAGERQLPEVRLAVAQNLGGQPGACVAFMAIVGTEEPA